MTNVSKIPVAPRIYRSIRKNLQSAVSAKHDNGPEILEALLTRSERTMLYKRLAIIILLEQNWSHYRITKLLKVGMPTVIRIDRHRGQGRFVAIRRAMKRRGGLTLLEHIELFLAAGMPSIAGRRHDTRLNELRARRRA